MRLSRKELGAELRAVKAAVSSRPGIPALTGALLEASNDGRELTITATDLEATVRTEIAAEASDGGGAWRALVPFKVLADAVKGSGSVELSPADASTFRAGSVNVRTLPIEDFPSIVAGGTYVGRIEAQSFRETVGAVAPAASGDAARPVLTGVLIETEPSGFRMTATDSYRLHTSDAGGVVVGECKAIIPARALEAVARRIGAKGAGDVVLELSEGSVAFRITSSSGSEYRLVSRVIEGEFPNWRQLMPEPAYENRIRGLGELPAAVESVGRLCRDTNPVRIEFNSYDGRAVVSASSPDLGSASESVAVEYVGEPMAVAFNPQYLGGTFKAVGPDGSFEIRDGLKPGVCRSTDGRTVALVMPVRLPAPVEVPPAPIAEPPIEPSAEEREAGAEVEEPETVSEEPEPKWTRCAHGYEAGECHVDVCRNASPTAAAIARSYGVSTAPEEPAPSSEPAVGARSAPIESEEGWRDVAEVGRIGAIRVRIVESRGSRFVDVRRFVESKRYSGPSRKGVLIPLEDVGELSRLLEGAELAR